MNGKKILQEIDHRIESLIENDNDSTLEGYCAKSEAISSLIMARESLLRQSTIRLDPVVIDPDPFEFNKFN